jgi:lipocalin
MDWVRREGSGHAKSCFRYYRFGTWFQAINPLGLRAVITSASILMLAGLLTGCVGVPKGVKPVQGFELNRYLGRWYEIARLDHSFERGLSHVTADYSMRENGGVRVLNRGYSEKTKEWKTAEGQAYFVNAGRMAKRPLGRSGSPTSSW